MVKKIGLYGGSFDPIHFGHLNLAIEILEAHQLDEVWFIPSSIGPFKPQGSVEKAEHRLNMLKLACLREPRFIVSDIEAFRPGPSYTIDTIYELFEKFKFDLNPSQLFLILGEDAACEFSNWYRAGEIISYVGILTGCRGDGARLSNFKGNSIIAKKIQEGLTPTRMLDISSTEIRHRLKQRLYCEHLVPSKVLDYILSNQLYLATN